MAKSDTAAPVSMKDAADELMGLLEDADPTELAQIQQGGVKDSKWRRVAEGFLSSGKEVQKIRVPEPTGTEGELTFTAVTAGLQNVVRRAKRAGNPLNLKVKSSSLKREVYLVNTELVSSDAAPGDDVPDEE